MGYTDNIHKIRIALLLQRLNQSSRNFSRSSGDTILEVLGTQYLIIL